MRFFRPKRFLNTASASSGTLVRFPIHLGLALSLIATSVACKTTRATGSFLMDTGAPLTTETAVTSTRPLDSGSSFRMGYGYDKLSGERRRSCLDPLKFDLMGRNVRSTSSDFSIVNTKEDLAKKLNIEVNAEASGSYGTITGSASSKTTILKNSNFNARSIVGIVSFAHKAQEISIESDYQALADRYIDLLRTDPRAFRLRCGDGFTKSVTTGAAMYLMVNLTSKQQEITNKVETVNSVKAAFGAVFSASASTAVSRESQETLANFNINVSCHSVGTTLDACAQSLTTVDPNDLSGFINYINAAKSALAQSVNATPDLLVAIDEIFEDYAKPEDLISLKRDQIFFSYAPQAAIINSLLEKENEVNYICSSNLYKSCLDVRIAFSEQFKFCARQENWADCNPASIDVQKLLSEEQMKTGIGKVVFWEHHKHGFPGGKTLTFDFDKPSTDPNYFQEGRIYNLNDYNFSDIASGYQSSLRPGWQLRVFVDRDGGGRCWMVGSNHPEAFFLGWMNDGASSVRLEKVGSYPTSCN